MNTTLSRLALALAIILVATSAVTAQPASLERQLWERDNLIIAQENLLNDYRCRFNVDTSVVSGGCSDGKPFNRLTPPPQPAATPTATPQPTATPTPKATPQPVALPTFAECEQLHNATLRALNISYDAFDRFRELVEASTSSLSVWQANLPLIQRAYDRQKSTSFIASEAADAEVEAQCDRFLTATDAADLQELRRLIDESITLSIPACKRNYEYLGLRC